MYTPTTTHLRWQDALSQHAGHPLPFVHFFREAGLSCLTPPPIPKAALWPTPPPLPAMALHGPRAPNEAAARQMASVPAPPPVARLGAAAPRPQRTLPPVPPLPNQRGPQAGLRLPPMRPLPPPPPLQTLPPMRPAPSPQALPPMRPRRAQRTLPALPPVPPVPSVTSRHFDAPAMPMTAMLPRGLRAKLAGRLGRAEPERFRSG